MKPCLNCQKGFEPKREHAKFCSDKCRVMYNRKYPAQNVSKWQMQALYNEIRELVSKINYSAPKETYDAPRTTNIKDEPNQYIPTPKVAAEAIMRKYAADKIEITCEEEYLSWLERLNNDNRLTDRQKQLITSTNH